MRSSSRRLHALVLLAALGIAAVALTAACGDDEADEVGGGATATLETTPSGSFAQACQKSDEKEFAEPPPQIIDTSKTYVATVKTAKGNIVVELFSDVPVTTNNFVFLACKGFYDGVTFWRVEPEFVIQGGDPTGTGAGGPGYTIPGEFEGATFDAGVMGMARKDDPDSAGSQFFITLEAANGLDNRYAAFGRVTEGMDVAKKMAIGDVMETITIEER